jgi:hypothetical protein
MLVAAEHGITGAPWVHDADAVMVCTSLTVLMMAVVNGRAV